MPSGPSMPGARVMELSAFAQACFVAAERLERAEDPDAKRWHANGMWALEQIEQEYDRQAGNAERMAERHNERVRQGAAPGEEPVRLKVHRPPGVSWAQPPAATSPLREVPRGSAVPAEVGEQMTAFLERLEGNGF